MNELKPEDVMRALERCLTLEHGVACKGCPLSYEDEERTDCLETLMKSALALLREKDAEIERLQEIADAVADSFPVCEGCKGKTELGERTEDCVYEIDGTFCAQRATKMWFALRGENEELHKEVERLNKELDGQFEKWEILAEKTEKHYAELYQDAKQVVRSEAITEFLERVCKEVEKTPNANEFFINAWKVKFAEIAKELKEKTNGKTDL